MKNELVSYELAKLAKEFGFDYQVHWFFNGEKLEFDPNLTDFNNSYWEIEEMPSFISVPTQSLLQRWFREEHNIDIISLPVRFTGHEDIGYWTYAVKSIQPVGKQIYKFQTYEKALDAGLLEGFKYLKNVK
jgi:hypothetical protein